MIYIYDTEAPGLVHEVDKWHCLVFKELNKDKFHVFCNYKELDQRDKEYFESIGAMFYPVEFYLKLINSDKTKGLICHNQLSFDLALMEKLDNISYDSCSINGRELFLCDTLVMSRNLNPERRLPKWCPGSIKNTVTGKMDKIGPHGLDSWAYRTNIAKPEVHDWTTQPLKVYVNRCIEDTQNNEATYFMLVEEMKSCAIDNGDKKGDWRLPIKLAHKSYYLMCQQENTGVLFDKEKARDLVIQIDKEMGEIESKVEPELGERYLPKNQQPQPPKQPWKKAFDYKNPYTQKGLKKPVVEYLEKIGYTDTENQKKYIKSMCKITDIAGHIIVKNYINDLLTKHKSLLSSSSISYCSKIGIEDEEDMFNEILRLDKKGENPVQIKEKLRLKHKKDVKEFLIKDGWVPTMWKERNILIDKKTKKKLSLGNINKKYDKYIKEFYGSIYWPFIIKELGYKRDPDITTKAFKDRCIKNGRNLISSPQFKDQRGVRCVNLKRLTGDTSKLIIRWLSLQNRRNTIESLPSKTKKAYTGWLHHPRLEIDGRLPARSSGITNTFRQRHATVVNVPKPKDHVVLGKEMRGLFIPRKGYYQLGCDACGLEARIMGHFTYPFDDGKFADEILEGDIHSKNSTAFSKAVGQEILRDDTKNLFYAIIYGTAPKKASKMASVDEEKGKFLIDSFWSANPGLKDVKEAVAEYWKRTGRKYIMGIDGRKVFVRSAHSAMNALFQSTGAIIMDFAGCWADAEIKKEGLDFYRTLYVHDEYGGEHSKDEIKIDQFDYEPDQERDGILYSATTKTGKYWTQYYSRAGELIAKGIEEAGKYYNMNLPFPGEYKIGRSWAETH